MTVQPLANRRTAVYRLFDNDDTLLYVGCSYNPDRRVANHLFKPWGRRIADVTVDWYENRPTALIQEARAITEEAPVHNFLRPHPDRVQGPRLAPAPCKGGLSLQQAAEEVDVSPLWLWRGLVRGDIPHSCSEPEGVEVWFAPDDIRDLHVICDPPPIGLEKQRKAARHAIRQAVRIKRCCHFDCDLNT